MATDLTAMDTMDTGLMAMDTTERGLLRPRPSPLPMLLLMPLPRLIPGMGITAMVDTEAMVTELMATATGLMAMEDTTTERGLLRPRLSPLLMLLLLLPLMLMLKPGTDTMAMAAELMAMVAITGHMAMEDTTMERGLLRPSPLPMLLLRLLLRPIPATDTDLMAMDTGERSKKCDFCQTAAN